MKAKVVPPALGENSFSCPHCGALAAQTWFKLYAVRHGKDEKPRFPDSGLIARIRESREIPKELKAKTIEFLEKKLTKLIFPEHRETSTLAYMEMINVSLSYCYSCERFALWHADSLIYPAEPFSIEPNEDMPADVRLDFDEAAAIVDKSPRGAAALLRLAVEKLMPHLGATKKKIDDCIGELVENGLDPKVQKALDVVRVIGNHAVHPGQIDLQDDKATAIKLFRLVNVIVETMITSRKHIEEMYEGLPEGARKAIEKRDGTLAIEPPATPEE